MSAPIDARAWNAARHTRRRRGCLLLIVLPLGVISLMLAWAGVRLFDRPNIARNFTAEFNTRFENIPEDQKAWPLYRQAIIERLAVKPSGDLLMNWPTFPGGPMWDDSAEQIAKLQPVLDKVRQAAALPCFGRQLSDRQDPDILRAEAAANGQPYIPEPPGEPNPMMLGVLLPDPANMRNFAKDLSVDTYFAAEAGHGERAVRNFEAMLGLSVHARESETLIGQLVQIAIEALAERQLAQILSNYPDLFARDQLERLQAAFTTIGRPGPAPDEGITRFDLNMTMERAFFYDIVQRSFSDDGKGNGHMTLEGARVLSTIGSLGGSTGENASMMAAALLSASRRSTVDKYDGLMDRFEAAAAKRPWQRQPGELELGTEVEQLHASKLGRARYPLITMLMPALSKAALHKDLADARRDAAITTIALARYHADHRCYPAALSDLMSDYLPALPLDPVDGQPLRYLHTPRGPILYSLGFDKDDDQGRAPENSDLAQPLVSTYPSGDKDGDWVLYPSPMPQAPEENDN
ncbi:MAG: hypothetical protein KJZ65_05545 [Phycisphaerales bacterium]|nr:hypothetical protein [Phycisphaerales bacterium]